MNDDPRGNLKSEVPTVDLPWLSVLADTLSEWKDNLDDDL